MVNAVKREIGMSNNVCYRVHKKTTISSPKRSKLFRWHGEVKAKIVEFVKRGDNSACLPGKRDTKKVGTETRQRYVLNDYLENLHVKFLSDNPAIQLSYTTFTRIRPKEIIPVSYSSRKTCLCERHQNFALKLIPLKRMKVINTANPDVFRKNYDNDEKLQKVLSQVDDDARGGHMSNF